MLKVLIVDDHALLRSGVIKILEEHYNDIKFGEASCASETFEIIIKQKWDIIILDINMPGRNGLEVIKELKRMNHNLPILILSMYHEDEFALRVFKDGADGYLMKDSVPEKLVNAIDQILDGKKYISPEAAELLTRDFENVSKKNPIESLSDREFEVMSLIASGKTVSQIAEELSLSVKTISTYRTHILEKLKLKNNAEIMRYVIDNKVGSE